MLRAENIPEKLKALPQWITWRSRPKGNGKTDKIPYDPRTNSNIDHLNPQNQLAFEESLKLYNQNKSKVAGIGFVFTAEDPFSGIDLDDCFDGQRLEPAQQAIVRKLDSFSEISPSGKGVKIFLEGRLPGPNKNTPSIEMYSHSRFFTVTGNILNGNSALVQPRQKELELIYFQNFPEEHPRFGELFSSCYLMRFLLEKSRSGVNLSHSVRRALASFSVALDDLETEEMPFITLMLSGCPDFDPEITRKQLESLKKSLPYGCSKLKEIARDHFSDFEVSRCDCKLAPKEGRKPSPIRFVAPKFVEVAEWEEEDPEEEPRSPLPSFPLSSLPAQYAEAVQEIAEAHTTAVEIPAIALLTFTGACIGKTRGIQPKRGYIQYPNLYCALIGPSGIGKTQAVLSMSKPIADLENQWAEQYQEELKAWEWEKEQRKLLSKEEKLAQGPLRDKPSCKELTVNDSTTEALALAFNNNPRGILWTRDELLGMVLSFDKYTGQEGETKTLVNSAHDYVDWKINRVGKFLYVSRPCLSIFGGIQPELVKEAFSQKDAHSGFLPRFFFVKIERDHPALWEEAFINEGTYKVLADLFHRCLKYQFEEGQPVIVYFSPEAFALYREYHDKIAIEPWVTYLPKKFRAVTEKLKMKCLRLILILHCMETTAAKRPETSPVDVLTVRRAVELSEFFKSHQKHVYEEIFDQLQAEEIDPLAERVLSAILKLENKIEKGKLPTGLITDFLNAQGDARFQVEPESVGRMARSLGLKVTRVSGGKRAFGIKPEDLLRLKRLARNSDRCDGCDGFSQDENFEGKEEDKKLILEKTVTTVTTVTKEEGSEKTSLEKNVTNVTNVTEESDPEIIIIQDQKGLEDFERAVYGDDKKEADETDRG